MSALTKESIDQSIAEAAENLGLEEEELRELLPEVMEDTLERIKELQVKVTDGAPQDEVMPIAHEIRGVCLNYGLKAAGDIATDIEIEGGTKEKADELLSIMKQVIELSV